MPDSETPTLPPELAGVGKDMDSGDGNISALETAAEGASEKVKGKSVENPS